MRKASAGSAACTPLRPRFSHSTIVRRHPASKPVSALPNLMEFAAAANAEACARKEGKEQVGKKTGGVQEMQSVPASLLTRKPQLCASVLQKMGCLSISQVTGRSVKPLFYFCTTVLPTPCCMRSY